MAGIEKARKVIEQRQKEEKNVEIVMQVRDLAHAKSESVLKFCIKELTKGSSWNVLRRKLGLGHSGIDRRWRVLKEILCSSIMPDSEEDALAANFQSSQYMLTRIEQFIEDVEGEVQNAKGTEEYAKVVKVHLDSIKLQMEAYNKRFEFYAKMKELKVSDQKGHGPSVIYQNNYFVPRPGQNVEWKDGRPVLNLDPPSVDVGKTAQLADSLSKAKKK